MGFLIEKIESIHKITKVAEDALIKSLKKVESTKGDFLVSEGKVCKHLYFLETGAVRGFYNVDGKEITHWFGFESDFVTSFHSFITEESSVEYVQAVEDAVLWSISKKEMSALFDQYPEIERLVRMAYEKYYIRLEERYVNAQFKTAKQRYDELLDTNPKILLRAPLGYIASFLGISQETLSRIRGKK